MIVDGHVYCLPERLRRVSAVLPKSERAVVTAIYSHKESATVLKLSAPEAILKSMRAARIDRSVLVAFPWQNEKLCTETNEHLLDLVGQGSRFDCITSVQPRKRGWQGLARFCLENGALGLKVNPSWQGFDLDGPEMDAVCRFAVERNVFVMIHVDAAYKKSVSQPADLLALVSRHPKTKIWASHLGGLLGLYHLHPPIKKKLKNIWFDTAVSSTLKFVDFYVQAGLEHKIIFGSDFPFNHSHSQSQVLSGLRGLSLGAGVNQQILSENFYKLTHVHRNARSGERVEK